MVVHGLCADLDFNRAASLISDHGVQRLITIGLGLGDVVVKLTVDGRKISVDKSQRGVAAFDVSCDDTQRANVKHLVKVQRLATHLFDDAVNVFWPALHQRGDALLIQRALQLRPQRLHEAFTVSPLFVEQASHLLVHLGFEKAEGQVFHFPFELPDAQAIRQWRKHMQRLVRQ